MDDDIVEIRAIPLEETPENNKHFIRCLEEGPNCVGKVEYRLSPDRDDMKSFPRCEFHWGERLDQAEKNRELLSDVPPAWFDPAYAGERWDEDE